MKIELHNISKRYNKRYIFKNISHTFASGKCHYIQGANGSGKSTLLQIIAGILTPNTGEVSYTTAEKKTEREQVAMQLSIAAPYLELIEEMTLSETIRFHFSLRKPLTADYQSLLHSTLGYDPTKQIRTYSSGMKQKLKLCLALLTQSQLVLLDEPTANFDAQNVAWYSRFVQEWQQGRTLIIASPQPVDIAFCEGGVVL